METIQIINFPYSKIFFLEMTPNSFELFTIDFKFILLCLFCG
jgi:hypothetical protein